MRLLITDCNSHARTHRYAVNWPFRAHQMQWQTVELVSLPFLIYIWWWCCWFFFLFLPLFLGRFFALSDYWICCRWSLSHCDECVRVCMQVVIFFSFVFIRSFRLSLPMDFSFILFSSHDIKRASRQAKWMSVSWVLALNAQRFLSETSRTQNAMNIRHTIAAHFKYVCIFIRFSSIFFSSPLACFTCTSLL